MPNKINSTTREISKSHRKYTQASLILFSPTIERIIKEIAKESDDPRVNIVEIKKVLSNYFKFTRAIFKSIESLKALVSIQWIYLGTFRPSVKRVNTALKANKLKEN